MKLEGKLELTWVGKNEEIKLEPRILVEDKTKSYGDPNTENMLIHGDNLLALKALEKEFTGKIKCIYIDPPYNTGSRINSDGQEIGYEDGVEHSEWLRMMHCRLILLRNLLGSNGSIYVQIDRNEQAYLKILMDEIFGRENFITMITCKVTSPGGLTGGTEMFFDSSEYVLVYAKNKNELDFNVKKVDSGVMGETQFGYNYKIDKIDFESKTFIKEEGGIKYYSIDSKNFKFDTIQNTELTPRFYYENYSDLFQTANLSGGIGKKIKNATSDLNSKDNLIICNYIPSKGKRKGLETNLLLWKNRIIYKLKDYVRIDDDNKKLIKLDYVTNIFNESLWNGISSEGNVTFNNGKKPEKFIQTLLEISSNPGDYVLDSFLGSGTTSAVAHKLNRKWIGIEMGPHCLSHCKKRLDEVINGEKTGISKVVNWQGGGGYKFYELAESLLVKNEKLPIYQINPNYTFEMMCEAICKIEGFDYKIEGSFHGKSSENRFIHITTEFVNAEYIKNLSKELSEKQSLLIYSTKFATDLRLPDNIVVKKIPKDLLKKCKFESEVR